MIITDEAKLREPSKKITDFAFAKELSFQLIEELNNSPIGIGLSAPQIGKFWRMFVMKSPSGFRTFINPEIIRQEKPFVHKREGCLSFSGVWVDTLRYKEITIKHQIDENNFYEEDFSGFGSIIILHENDHLDGILFMDRKVPDKYDKCFCGSGEKMKFCCWNKLE